MKILTLDIETRPNIAHVWGAYKQDIAPIQIREPGRVIAVSAKWHDARPVLFFSEYHNGYHEMIEAVWHLLDEADVVVTFNGDRFDLPWLNTAFAQAGLGLPGGYKSIDLYKVVKKNFRFPTNRLMYVCQEFGLGRKMQTTGHQMWVDIMEGDEETQRKAWNLMRRYNKQDVRITEELFDYLTPFIKMPMPALFDPDFDQSQCPTPGCDGSLVKRGFAYTTLAAYQRYRCTRCGCWFKSGKRLHGVDLRSAL